MPISEEVLVAWTKPASPTEEEECERAETAIRKAVAASDELKALDLTIFAQGSWAANTNVRRDSDVDVNIRLNSTVFVEVPLGTTKEQYGYGPGSVTFRQFKGMVGRALSSYFGEEDITPGNKAFTIKDNTYRVHADAVPTFEHRDHRHNPVLKGVAFDPDDGSPRVINYPQHALANGISKNNQTNRYYKRAVRILKRARNHLREQEHPAVKLCPSFQIESIVYNVPNLAFMANTWRDRMRAVIQHAYAACNEGFNPVEVNDIKQLFGNHSKWSRSDAQSYLAGVYQEIGL